MRIELRRISSSAPVTPDPGEIRLAMPEALAARRCDLALYLLQSGLDGLAQGAGPIETIVVSADPTLDDMLAAAIARRLLAGERPPAGIEAFARYAGLAREGVQPGTVPLEASLDGVYQAIRNARADDLLAQGVADGFLEDWARLESAIFAAAEAGRDPFATRLLDGAELARERAFLARDRDVYRQDVLRGERWLVVIPGAPDPSSALVLRQPKSLLAKQWSRCDAGAPAGGAYLLLAVEWAAGEWVFSTDPVQRLPIQPLALALQAAEARKDAARAAADPWFDGARFAHTLVASPRGRTLLSGAEVLEVARRWLSAKPVRGPGGRSRVALAAAGLAACALVAAGAYWAGTTRSVADFTPLARGSQYTAPEIPTLRSEGVHIAGFALLIGVGHSSYGALPGACTDTARVYAMLRDRYGFAPERMRLLLDAPDEAVDARDGRLPVDGPPDREHVERALEELSRLTHRIVDEDRSRFVFYYAGHGDHPAGSPLGYLVLAGYHEHADKARSYVGYDMGDISSDVRRRIKSTHQLLLLDCCFSGFTVLARGNPLDNPSAIYQAWKRRAHVILTAGTQEQQALQIGDRAVFSRAVLEGLGEDGTALADANHDGIVTDAELATFVQERVPELVPPSRRQTPVYCRGTRDDDENGQFLFIPAARP